MDSVNLTDYNLNIEESGVHFKQTFNNYDSTWDDDDDVQQSTAEPKRQLSYKSVTPLMSSTSFYWLGIELKKGERGGKYNEKPVMLFLM